MKTLVVSSFLMLAMSARATQPIMVVYGQGRSALIKRMMDAQTQIEKGDLAAARQNLDGLIKTDPTFYPAYFVRAKVSAMQGKYDEAIQDCNEALRQDSTFAEASLLRARANAARGRCAEALKEIDDVISIRPRQDAYARAYSARAHLRLTCSDPAIQNNQAALKDAMAGCKLIQWKDEDMIDTLAMAYARMGDFDSAVRYEERALKIKQTSAEEAKRLEQRLTWFKEHRANP